MNSDGQIYLLEPKEKMSKEEEEDQARYEDSVKASISALEKITREQIMKLGIKDE